MKLLFENWKKYLNEGPLDFGEYSSSDSGPARNPSIAHKLSAKRPTFVEDIKQIMSKTKDNWVIVTVDDVSNIEQLVEAPQFKEWLKSRKYPTDSKVLVVGSKPDPDDDESPDWILHDIIGHSSGRIYLDKAGYPNGAGHWVQEKKYRKNLILKVHNYLSKKGASVSKANQPFDMVYDIFASLIIGDISENEIMQLAETPEEQSLAKEIIEFSENWVNSVPSDVGQVTVVKPW